MNKKYVDIRITATSDEDLREFLIALRKIQFCGDIGANRLIPIQIDGDGSGQIDIEVHTKELKNTQLKNIRKIVALDQDKLKKVKDGEDFETHYVGE
jgi:phage-related protein